MELVEFAEWGGEVTFSSEIVLAGESEVEKVVGGVGRLISGGGEIKDEGIDLEVVVSPLIVVDGGVLVVDLREIDLEFFDPLENGEIFPDKVVEGEWEGEVRDLVRLVGLDKLREGFLEGNLELGEAEIFQIKSFSEFLEVGVILLDIRRIGGGFEFLFLLFLLLTELDQAGDIIDILVVVIGDRDSENGDQEVYLARDAQLVKELNSLDELVK